MGPSGYNFTGAGTPNQDKRPFQFGTGGTSGMSGLPTGQNLFGTPQGQSHPTPGMQTSLGQTPAGSQNANLFGFVAKPAGSAAPSTGMNFASASGGIGGGQSGLIDQNKPTTNIFSQSSLFPNQLPSPQKPTTVTSGIFQQHMGGTNPLPGGVQLGTQTGTGIPGQGTGLFNTTPFQGASTFGKQPQSGSFLGLGAQPQGTSMSLGSVQPIGSGTSLGQGMQPQGSVINMGQGTLPQLSGISLGQGMRPQGTGTSLMGQGMLPQGTGTSIGQGILPQGTGTSLMGQGILSQGTGTSMGQGIIPQGTGTSLMGQGMLPQGTGTSLMGQGILPQGTGTSMGQGILAQGIGTSLLGPGIISQGTGTTLMGQGILPQGTGTSMGQGSLPQGTGTTLMGQGSLPQGTGTTLMGQGILPQGTGTSMGQGSLPQGTGTTLMGQGSLPQGTGTTLMGQGILPQGTGTSMGQGSLPQGTGTTLMGQGILPHGTGTSLLGQGTQHTGLKQTQPLSQPQVTPQKQSTLGALQTPSPQTLHLSQLQTTPQNQTAQFSQIPLGLIGGKNPLPSSSAAQGQALSGRPALFQLPSSPSTALTTSTSGLPQVPAGKPQISILPPSTTTQPSLTGITLPGAVTTAVTTSSVPVVSLSSLSTSGHGGQTQTPAKKYTYRQLEDLINNWVMELDEQQKVFLSQAKLVNAWDLALLENEDSIISLHDDVAKAKTDQDRLDHDLNSILNQQAELEEMLTPLETYLSTQSLHASTQHADQERNKTYTMAEKIDANMKDMMQNLREVLDRINSINSANSDRNNPISQITSILNAHMDSLLSIDDRSGTLQQKLDELARKLDSKKRDQEARLKTAFS